MLSCEIHTHFRESPAVALTERLLLFRLYMLIRRMRKHTHTQSVGLAIRFYGRELTAITPCGGHKKI